MFEHVELRYAITSLNTHQKSHWIAAGWACKARGMCHNVSKPQRAHPSDDVLVQVMYTSCQQAGCGSACASSPRPKVDEPPNSRSWSAPSAGDTGDDSGTVEASALEGSGEVRADAASSDIDVPDAVDLPRAVVRAEGRVGSRSCAKDKRRSSKLLLAALLELSRTAALTMVSSRLLYPTGSCEFSAAGEPIAEGKRGSVSERSGLFLKLLPPSESRGGSSVCAELVPNPGSKSSSCGDVPSVRANGEPGPRVSIDLRVRLSSDLTRPSAHRMPTDTAAGWVGFCTVVIDGCCGDSLWP